MELTSFSTRVKMCSALVSRHGLKKEVLYIQPGSAARLFRLMDFTTVQATRFFHNVKKYHMLEKIHMYGKKMFHMCEREFTCTESNSNA